jgi:branched-subunit amino acid ABC-type transport system permease component
VVADLVTCIEWVLGRLSLSPFQVNALATLLVTAGGEFLITPWARFILNRRTVGIETRGP